MLRTGTTLIVLSLLIVQVAQAQTVRPQSDNYWMPSDVQPVGGGEAAKSTYYILDDTIGEANVGPNRSDTYDLNAGYRQTVAPAYIAMNCDDVANMGTITLSGVAEGSATCTVTTDADAGYALSWRAGTNNSNGLVGHWKMDETTGTTAYDSSGYGNDGTHTNSPTISTSVPSNYFSTRSLDFDGVATEYVNISHDPSIAISGDVTIAAWIYNDTRSGYDFIFTKESTSGWSGATPALYIDTNNKIHAARGNALNDEDGVSSNASINADVWYHVVATFEGASGKIYINGVLDNTGTISGTLSDSGLQARIGGRVASEQSMNFDGFIDDVRLYNRALSTAEIRDLASKAPPGSLVMSGSQVTHIAPINMPFTGGLLGHWKMDEPVAGTVADSSGNGNDGTPDGGPVVSMDIPSGANHVTTRSLSFDGTDDKVAATGFQGPPNGSISVSAWVRFTGATGSFAGIVGSREHPTKGFVLYKTSNEMASFWTYDGSSADSINGTTTIPTGEWFHIVGVNDGSRQYLYVNGMTDAPSEAAGPYVQTTNSSLPVTIGTNGQNNFFWTGQIDDVRIYDRALSAAEVAALYGTPQSWSVANTDARWGARLSSASDDTDAKWGTDNSSEKWLNVGEGTYPLVTRNSRTDVDGSDEVIEFRAEIGSAKVQPAGTYTSAVVFTASAL